MEIKDGYYNFEIQLDSQEEDFNAVLPHDPMSEKQLFSLALTELNQTTNPKNQNGYLQGVEIGVLNGETSAHILRIGNFIRLVGIDPIIPDSMEVNLIGSEELIKQNTDFAEFRWAFKKAFSHDVHSEFTDNSLDFIFIDGDHTYEAVKRDYELYNPKIKKGGLIFFHDSRMNRGGAQFHVGSSKFVDELIATTPTLKLIGEAFSLTCFKKF